MIFLGKDPASEKVDCPSLYDTDRDTYVVQGAKVIDPQILSRLQLTADETCVEVPDRLMVRLTNSRLIVADDGRPAPTIISTGPDTYVVKGAIVTDAEALGDMSIPEHETVVEVPKAFRDALKDGRALAGR